MLVTRGMLNLTHAGAEGHSNPQALVPHQLVHATVQLKGVCRLLKKVCWHGLHDIYA